MTGYVFDTRGLATIDVINTKSLVHLTKWWMREGAVKAAFEGRKNNSQGEKNYFKCQISCAGYIYSLMKDICYKRCEFQNLIIY